MKGLKVMWESRAKSGLTIGLLAGGLWALAIPMAVDDYWLRILTTTVIYVVVAAGVGLLFSRLGIVSLNQIALMGVGGWIFLRLSYWLDAVPGMLIMCLAGLATMGIGVLIGLPSLRLSGLSLAVVTLMFAAFAEIVFTSIGFPTGNNGWRGEPAPGETSVPIPSPAFAESNTGLWFYVVITTTVMLLLLWVFLTGRWGRAWAAIKQSEPGAVSIGIHVTSSKVTALAVVSFTTGVSGALLAVPTGSLVSQSFSAISSVILFAVVLIGGAFSLVGAVLAGLLFVALPPALEAVVARIPVVLDLLGPTFTNLIYGWGLGRGWGSPPPCSTMATGSIRCRIRLHCSCCPTSVIGSTGPVAGCLCGGGDLDIPVACSSTSHALAQSLAKRYCLDRNSSRAFDRSSGIPSWTLDLLACSITCGCVREFLAQAAGSTVGKDG